MTVTRIEFSIFAVTLACLCLISCAHDHIAIKERVPILPTEDCFNSRTDSGKIIGYLNAGDTVEVYSSSIPKDCMVFEVRLPNGRTGWVTRNPSTELIPAKMNWAEERVLAKLDWGIVEGAILVILAIWLGIHSILYLRRKPPGTKVPMVRYIRLVAAILFLILGLMLLIGSIVMKGSGQ